MWMKRWSNSTRVGHAAIPDSRRPDIRIGRAGEVGDRQRITVAAVGQHELALVVGAPELVGRRGARQRRALGLVAPPAATPHEAMAVEHRVDRADGGAR